MREHRSETSFLIFTRAFSYFLLKLPSFFLLRLPIGRVAQFFQSAIREVSLFFLFYTYHVIEKRQRVIDRGLLATFFFVKSRGKQGERLNVMIQLLSLRSGLVLT